MRLFAIITALLALAVTPAAAQEISSNNDRVLWCASAFYWLAATAEDAGDTEEAKLYDRWSKRLLDVGSAALTAIGFVPSRIETLIAAYDEVVLEELKLPEAAKYDAARCPEMLGDWR
jgi:hypothetical protein